MSLDLPPTDTREPVIYDPQGAERSYRVVYETDAAGHDSPFHVRLEFPNPLARYRVKVEVEQLSQEAT